MARRRKSKSSRQRVARRSSYRSAPKRRGTSSRNSLSSPMQAVGYGAGYGLTRRYVNQGVQWLKSTTGINIGVSDNVLIAGALWAGNRYSKNRMIRDYTLAGLVSEASQTAQEFQLPSMGGTSSSSSTEEVI